MKIKHHYLRSLFVTVGVAAIVATAAAVEAAPPTPTFDWATVVNNNDLMPGALEKNEPSTATTSPR